MHNALRKKCRSGEFSIESDSESELKLDNEEDEEFSKIEEQEQKITDEWRLKIASNM